MKMFLFIKKSGARDVMIEELSDTATFQSTSLSKSSEYDYLGCVKGQSLTVIPDTKGAKMSVVKKAK